MTVRWGRVGLVCTAVLYLWDLSANGYGNTFYAAAAQAGAHSWSTWFFVVSVAIAASLSQGSRPDRLREVDGRPVLPFDERSAGRHAHAVVRGDQRFVSAAALEIVSGTSVMAIGGWSSDPVPTLDDFIDDVRAGKITYYVLASNGGVVKPPARAVRPNVQGSSNILEIADWVAERYTAVPVGRSLVYYRLI